MSYMQEEKAYKAYITDFLNGMVDNKLPRYMDIICPAPQETRTAEEIIGHIRKKLEEVG